MDNWRSDEWRNSSTSSDAKNASGARTVKSVENNPSLIIDAEEIPEETLDASNLKSRKNTWTMWLMENDRTKCFADKLNQIQNVDTVEHLWKLLDSLKPPSDIKLGSDYSFFKKGISPMWETEANREGGRWSITVKKRFKQKTSYLWTHILLFILCEDLEHYDEVCGAQVQVRNKINKIAVWTAHAQNEAAVLEIGHKLRKSLQNLHINHLPLEYLAHKDVFKSPKTKPITL